MGCGSGIKIKFKITGEIDDTDDYGNLDYSQIEVFKKELELLCIRYKLELEDNGDFI